MEMEACVNHFFMLNNFFMMNISTMINNFIRCLAPALERYRYQQLISKISIEPIRTFLRSKSGCLASFVSIRDFWEMLDAMMQVSRCEQPLLTSVP